MYVGMYGHTALGLKAENGDGDGRTIKGTTIIRMPPNE